MNQIKALCLIFSIFYVTYSHAQGTNSIFHLINISKYQQIGSDNAKRIVGGTNVGLGQIPSHASLRNQANLHFCGASIISIRWVISAGHCTINRSQNSINVVVGTVTLNAGGVTHRSIRIVQHPEFSSFTLANDVSLVETETTFTLTAHIQTINLGIVVLGGGQNVEVIDPISFAQRNTQNKHYFRFLVLAVRQFQDLCRIIFKG